jgi:hypothetical protein
MLVHIVSPFVSYLAPVLLEGKLTVHESSTCEDQIVSLLTPSISLIPILQRLAINHPRVKAHHPLRVLSPDLESFLQVSASHHDIIIKFKNSPSLYQGVNPKSIVERIDLFNSYPDRHSRIKRVTAWRVTFIPDNDYLPN